LIASKRFDLIKPYMPIRNRTYPPLIIDQIYRDIDMGGIVVLMEAGTSMAANLDRMVGTVSNPMMDEDGGLNVLLEVIGSPLGLITKELLDAHVPLTLATSGEGDVTKDGTVYNFTLLYCFLTTPVITLEVDTCPHQKLI
jgi:hypothetical protein